MFQFLFHLERTRASAVDTIQALRDFQTFEQPEPTCEIADPFFWNPFHELDADRLTTRIHRGIWRVVFVVFPVRDTAPGKLRFGFLLRFRGTSFPA